MSRLFYQQKSVCHIGLMRSKLSPYQRILQQKEKNVDRQMLGFHSHKEKVSPQTQTSEQLQFKQEMQLKQLIHQWLNYQSKLHLQQTSNISNIVSSRIQCQLPAAIKIEQQHSPNHLLQIPHIERNPLSVELIHQISSHHPIMRKINFNLAQTLINIGVFKIYKRDQQIPYIFYNEKYKIKCQENKSIGFVIYGKLKLSNKDLNYQKVIDQSYSIGQHSLNCLGLKFTQYSNYRVKSIDDQTSVLWIAKNHFQILIKQSIKCYLKEEMNRLMAYLKRSWIQKTIKKQ